MEGGDLTETSQIECDHGSIHFYKHHSKETKTEMKFAIYLPPKACDPEPENCSVVYYLAGLTCNEQSFITNKWITEAGATKIAAELDLILVCLDTSPRGCSIAGENDSWDFGTSAGYYVDATEPKWRTNYRMYSYITKELPKLIESNFPALSNSRGIFGHSMGGHGAFICAFKNPGFYKSVSGLAAICNPMKCAMGKKALTGYLGVDKEAWKQYDACALVTQYSGPKLDILLDQGMDDGVLDQMLPQNLVVACASNDRVMLTYREQEGHDHSYRFVATFIEDHLRHHAKHLRN